ncbi:MAG: DUF86 domain-containing protein [Candidatus Altarchaeum sp.]|nr:DUF86 domain-containing protein [Candidatus Altarchaeum sp.]
MERGIMLDRLKLLENNIVELEDFKNKYTTEDIKTDKTKEWALRYGLLETIQIVIDISCHITAKFNLGNPKTYAECVELLKKHNYVDKRIEKQLIGMIGLRNVLVHEYIAVDIEKLYLLLHNIKDLKEFAESIKDYLSD